MKNILITLIQPFVLNLIKQTWFQQIVANKLIQVINNSQTDIDNKIYDFLNRNKRDLLSISKREAKLTVTEIDDSVVAALQTLVDGTSSTGNTVTDTINTVIDVVNTVNTVSKK